MGKITDWRTLAATGPFRGLSDLYDNDGLKNVVWPLQSEEVPWFEIFDLCFASALNFGPRTYFTFSELGNVLFVLQYSRAMRLGVPWILSDVMKCAFGITHQYACSYWSEL